MFGQVLGEWTLPALLGVSMNAGVATSTGPKSEQEDRCYPEVEDPPFLNILREYVHNVTLHSIPVHELIRATDGMELPNAGLLPCWEPFTPDLTIYPFSSISRYLRKIPKSTNGAMQGAAGTGLFALMDGHKGAQAAHFVQKNLDRVLVRHPEFWKGNIHLAVRETIALLDSVMRLTPPENEPEPTRWVGPGTTLSMFLVIGLHCWVASVGDTSVKVKRFGSALQTLTREHGTQLPKEVQRIAAIGSSITRGEVPDVPEDVLPCERAQFELPLRPDGRLVAPYILGSDPAYLCDELSVTRSIGGRYGVSGLKVPGLLSIPDQIDFFIDPGIAYILIVTDGVTDVLPDQEIDHHCSMSWNEATEVADEADASLVADKDRIYDISKWVVNASEEDRWKMVAESLVWRATVSRGIRDNASLIVVGFTDCAEAEMFDEYSSSEEK